MSSFSKLHIKYLKDKIEPMININFKTLGYVKIISFEKMRFIKKEISKNIKRKIICLLKLSTVLFFLKKEVISIKLKIIKNKLIAKFPNKKAIG